MKFRVNWKHLAIGLGVLPFAAVFVAWIGFFNVGAASGHWAVTDWFLHFAMRSAVRTYAIAIDAPAPLPRGGVQPAAGHYARGCAICHGAPGEPRSPAVLQMLPRPPDLVEIVDEWEDEELFRIVKHGVRFTGMPAWPTQQRDDEIWAMVAFLRELPHLDAEAYRDLAFGSGQSAESAAANGDFDAALAGCVRCHGEDGRGRDALVPVIAGQRPAYLAASLRAYAAGERPSGVMELAVNGLDPALMDRLARHFAELPFSGDDPASPADGPETLVERGREIAGRGIPEDQVPACLSCHARPDRNPVFPLLAGQKAPYIENQLYLFGEEKRGGTGFHRLMTAFAGRLEKLDRAALAAYFATQPPEEAGD